MRNSRVMISGLLFGSLALALPMRAQGASVSPASEDYGVRVMQAVAEKIGPQRAGAVATIVGIPKGCKAAVEAALCEGGMYSPGQPYSAAGLMEATKAARQLASVLGLTVSSAPTQDALAFIAPPVADTVRYRGARFHFCSPGPYVLTILPSGIRETKGAAEWRVLVAVASNPVRGECMGGGGGSDYIVVRDPASGAFRVSDVRYLGSGDGHIWRDSTRSM